MADTDMKTFFDNVMSELEDAITNVGQAIKDGVDDATWSISDIFETSGEDLQNAGEEVKANVEDLADSVSDYFNAVGDVLHARYEKLKKLIAIRGDIQEVEDETGLDLSGVYNAVKDIFTRSGKSFSQEVKEAETKNDIKEAVTKLQAFAVEAADILQKTLENVRKKQS